MVSCAAFDQRKGREGRRTDRIDLGAVSERLVRRGQGPSVYTGSWLDKGSALDVGVLLYTHAIGRLIRCCCRRRGMDGAPKNQAG